MRTSWDVGSRWATVLACCSSSCQWILQSIMRLPLFTRFRIILHNSGLCVCRRIATCLHPGIALERCPQANRHHPSGLEHFPPLSWPEDLRRVRNSRLNVKSDGLRETTSYPLSRWAEYTTLSERGRPPGHGRDSVHPERSGAKSKGRAGACFDFAGATLSMNGRGFGASLWWLRKTVVS